MDLHDFLRSRKSVRRFAASPIPDALINTILTTATFAPSAHNRQPWRFAVVSTADRKSTLAAAMIAEYRRDLAADGVAPAEIENLVQRTVQRIMSAPLVVVLCMDISEMDSYPDPRRAQAERTMALQSTASAGVTLLLAAHAEGLGAVWNCSPLFAPSAANTSLDLPATWEPQAMILIGWPEGTPKRRPRKPLEEVTVFA